MKKILSILGLMFLLVGITACEKEVDAKNAYVTVDINPSFEILTDDSGLILEVVSGNEDADVVLYGLEIKGKTLDEGLELIINESYNLGFIKGEKNVFIDVCKNENAEALLNHLYKQIKGMKKLKLNVHKEYKSGVNETLDSLKAEADRVNMKLSEYRMALRLKAANAEMTFERAKNIDIKDANECIRKNAWMYRHRHGSAELELRIDGYKKFLNKNLLRKARIVDALGKLILATNPEYFKELSPEAFEPKDAVNLYSEYVRELESVNIITVDADYTDLIATIEADPEFISLEQQLKDTVAEIEVLLESREYDQEILTALEEKIAFADELIKRINERINEIINDDTLIGIYVHGTIIIRPVIPVVNPYREIRERYAVLFVETFGFEIDAYEAHVLAVLSSETIYGAIKAEFEVLLGELESELNELKDLCRQSELEYELELEYKNEYFKAKTKMKKQRSKR
ncbi:MAG: hypothetical protein GX931_00615 [Acholeplasmataceae bacterium]|nr:hypothetical protein [Acholeplasmataceae bacterium]